MAEGAKLIDAGIDIQYLDLDAHTALLFIGLRVQKGVTSVLPLH